jgi:hypothetical protein
MKIDLVDSSSSPFLGFFPTQHRLSLSLLAAHLCILPEDLIWHSEIPRQPEPKAAHVFSYLAKRAALQRHLLEKITTTCEQ